MTFPAHTTFPLSFSTGVTCNKSTGVSNSSTVCQTAAGSNECKMQRSVLMGHEKIINGGVDNTLPFGIADNKSSGIGC